MAALIKASADEMIEKKARSTNKFRYQANRAYIIGRLKWFVPKFLSKTSTMLALDDIFEGAVAVPLRFSLAVKTSGTSETVIENENISTIENE